MPGQSTRARADGGACSCARALARADGAVVVQPGWVHTVGRPGSDDDRTYAGKWLVVPGCATVVQDWTTVCRLTDHGALWAAKVSDSAGRGIDWWTGLPFHTICVYTLDFRDVAAVQAVGASLWRLGLVRHGRPIFYKPDTLTDRGRYAESGWASIYSLSSATAALSATGGYYRWLDP